MRSVQLETTKQILEDSIYDAGRRLSRSFLEVAFKGFFVITAFSLAITFVANLANLGVDSSDGSGFERSQMAVRVDRLTGCEYLETSSGAITPRLSVTGKQICKKEGK